MGWTISLTYKNKIYPLSLDLLKINQVVTKFEHSVKLFCSYRKNE